MPALLRGCFFAKMRSMPLSEPHSYRTLSDLVLKGITKSIPSSSVFNHLKTIEADMFSSSKKLQGRELRALRIPDKIWGQRALGAIIDPEQVIEISKTVDGGHWHAFLEELNQPTVYTARKVLSFMQCLIEMDLIEVGKELDGYVQLLPSLKVLANEVDDEMAYGLKYDDNDKNTCIELKVDPDNNLSSLTLYPDENVTGSWVNFEFNNNKLSNLIAPIESESP